MRNTHKVEIAAMWYRCAFGPNILAPQPQIIIHTDAFWSLHLHANVHLV